MVMMISYKLMKIKVKRKILHFVSKALMLFVKAKKLLRIRYKKRMKIAIAIK